MSSSLTQINTKTGWPYVMDSGSKVYADYCDALELSRRLKISPHVTLDEYTKIKTTEIYQNVMGSLRLDDFVII